MPDKTKKLTPNTDEDPANRDPITGAPGSHPVGTGVGAAAGGAAGIAGGAAAGAAAGTVGGGPIGALVGGAVGAVIGGLAGKAVAEQIDPTVEETYWRERYRDEPYYDASYGYDDYAGAYQTGWEGYSRYGAEGKSYDEVEAELRQSYEITHPECRLQWEKAQPAVRAAWGRFDSRTEKAGRLDPNDNQAAEELRQREIRPRSERQKGQQ